jgi:hypothetical protein
LIQDYIRRQFNISTLKWIVFGASYSAMKSIIHRIKYPDRFYAAYASSAPIDFRYDMPKYMAHVGEVILDPENGGSEVGDKLKTRKPIFKIIVIISISFLYSYL